MKKNRFLLKMITLGLIFLLAITGCNKYNEEAKTDGSKDGNKDTPAVVEGSGSTDTFNFATNQDIPHLDPHGTAANTSFRVTYMLYDRLVTYDGTDTEVKPQLADKMGHFR